MDKINPIPIKLATIDHPPCEIKGKGIPVKGNNPVAAPIFSKTWKQKHHDIACRYVGIVFVVRFQGNP